ncbi:transcriptional regulator [Halobacteriales archaeon QS_1_68_20]|nr:MAG: transcriptional regulator [Halobacteriales archaeon QS_1_68_20]
MSERERLQRLLADEGSEDDVEKRLVELDDLEDEAAVDADADLELLGTLSNETRYSIVRLLVAANRELTVAELDAVLGVSQSAISHALRDLTDVGLVERRRKGTWRYYHDTDLAADLIAALAALRE